MLFNSLGRINWSCRDFVFWLMLFRVMILFWRSLKGGVRLRAVFLRWVGKFRKSRRNYRSERRYLPDNRRQELGVFDFKLSDIWQQIEQEREKLSADPVMHACILRQAWGSTKEE